MYARVVTVQVQPGKTEEAVHIFRDSVIPAAKQQQSFRGALWLKDAKADKMIVITLWETEADLKATETSGFYQEQVVKFASVVAGPSTREVYEANVQI